MSKSKKPTPAVRPGDRIAVRFDAVAHTGAAKGTPTDSALVGLVVFCPGMAPGDEADVVVVSADGRYIVATPDADAPRRGDSPLRVEASCPVASRCGGCDFQHIDIAAQRGFKREFVEYRLKRSVAALPEIADCVASPVALDYRHRIDLQVETHRGDVLFGFMAKASNDLVTIDACPIADPRIGERLASLRAALRELALGRGARFRMRVVVDEMSGVVIALPADEDQRETHSWALVNDTTSDAWRRIERVPEFAFPGDGYELRYPPACFTQVNPGVNRLLIDAVLRAIAPRDGLAVLELYCGIGNFTIPLALAGASVVGVESDGAAARCARANAMRLGLGRVEIRTLTAQGACAQARSRREPFDAVLADPPRAGLGERTARDLCETRPMRIAYVSCDLDALAADLKILAGQGYRIRAVTPFDMFPQTRHVEVLVELGLV
ncbi:MAG: class I SAM-dependent RNA methyltransferase [Deltaproteobacteria bacterium]|nr:class I SAM-dependent RNA methyltransferase [Deltaproteobacteria bacterium]